MSDVRDIVLVGVLLFAFGSTFLVVHSVTDMVVSGFENNSEVNSSSSAVEAFQSMRTTSDKLDYVVGGLLTALLLGIIITGWFVGGHPIFAIIYFVVVIIAIVVSAVMSNVWEAISTSAQLASSLSSFPITNHLLTYLPRYTLISGFLGVVIMFGKPKQVFQE